MAYRDNVTALAAKRGLANDPVTGLREEDLGIGGLLFGEEGSTMVQRIIGGKMNRASRLFFEHHAWEGAERKRVISGPEFKELKVLAPSYFAELWEDTSERPLLDAFKHAESVAIYWKDSPTWLADFNCGWDEILPDPEWPL